MQSRILCGLITHAAFALVVKNEVRSRYLDSRADTIAIGLRTDQRDFQPVIGVSPVIPQQLRRLPIVIHENVEIAIVVEVADRRSAAHPRQQKSGPNRSLTFSKIPCPLLRNISFGSAYVSVAVIALNIVEDVPRRHE